MKKILIRTLIVIGSIILILLINLVLFTFIASRTTEGVPITASGSDNTALLIIDIQEGTTGTISVTESYKDQSDELIRNLNLITQTALEKNWSIIYIRSEVVNPLINLLNNTMARGSEGAELDKRLIPMSETVVTKRRNDSFNKTTLDQILEENQTGKLVVVGLDAISCVNQTVQAALNREYQVSVIQEGIISEKDSEKNRILDEFREMGVEILSLDQ